MKYPPFNEEITHDLHQYLFAYSCRCAEYGIEKEDALEHLSNCVAELNYRREVPEREIEEAVASAYLRGLEGPVEEEHAGDEWSEYNATAAAEAAEEFGTNLEDLKDASPLLPPCCVRAALEQLFDPEDLVCLGMSTEHANTRPLHDWVKMHDTLLDAMQFVVPHPMSAVIGLTKQRGTVSKRCHANTGPRKRIVCDFDKPRAAIQPALIAYLADYCGEDPELVLTSGGKSLHAWWRIDDWSDEARLTFETEATRIGADDALLGDARKCQWVRLPAGRRENGKRQTIHFWNPKQNKR